MPFSILCNGQLIGTSDFESADLNVNVLLGEFHPAVAYRVVAYVFALYLEALATDPPDKAKLAEYAEARAALGLELQDPSGRPVAASIVIFDESLMGDREGSYAIQAVVQDEDWFHEERKRRDPETGDRLE